MKSQFVPNLKPLSINSAFLALIVAAIFGIYSSASAQTCDADFAENYISTKFCVTAGSPEACQDLANQISIKKKLGQAPGATVVLGAVIGAAAGRAYGQLTSARNNDPFLKDWEMARQKILAEKVEAARIQRAYLEFQDKEVRAVTNNRFSSLQALREELARLESQQTAMSESDKVGQQKISKKIQSVRFDLERALHNSKAKATAAADLARSHQGVPANKLSAADLDRIEKGKAFSRIIKDPTAAPRSNLSSAIALVKKLFPTEAAVLTPYIEDVASGKISMDRKDAQMLEMQKAAAKSPRLRMVAGLFHLGGHEPLITHRGLSLAGTVKDQAKLEHGSVKLSTSVAAYNIARGGAVGAAFGGVVEGIRLFRQKSEINSCQKELNVPDYELDFLKGEWFISPTKVQSDDVFGDNCKTMYLKDPVRTIESAFNKFGFLPPGTCQIMKNEMERFKAIVGDINPDSTEFACDETKSNGLKILTKGSTSKLEYADGLRVVKADLRNDGYPDYRTIEILKPDSSSRLAGEHSDFTARYAVLHPASVTEQYPDIVDFEVSCRENVSTLPCNIVQAGVRARVIHAILRLPCESLKDKTAKPQSPKTPADGTI